MTVSDTLLLVVDDTPENIMVLRSMLADRYRLKVATNGEKALRIAHSNASQLGMILLDVMMPGMDGYDVCQRLKESDDTRHIPVLFITARTAQEDKNRAQQLGAVGMLHKPVNAQELQDFIRRGIN